MVKSKKELDREYDACAKKYAAMRRPDHYKEMSRKNYQKRRNEENERRRQLGMPLLGETFRGEKDMKYYLSRIFPNETFFDNCFWKFECGKLFRARKGLQLDRYYPKQKIAFEYNGEQHYRPHTIFAEHFEQIVNNDQRRRLMCQLAGITLLEIRYDEPISVPILAKKLNDIGIFVELKNCQHYLNRHGDVGVGNVQYV